MPYCFIHYKALLNNYLLFTAQHINSAAFQISRPISISPTDPGPKSDIDIGQHFKKFDWFIVRAKK